MSKELVLRLKRILPAPRADVYRALTDPRELAKWWGPRGFTAPSMKFDPRVGDGYEIAMQPPDGDLFHLSGEFLEVDPPERLAYTFRWDPPDPDDRQTVARLSLKERGDRTEVLLTQGEFATEERLALHREGWTDSLGRLEQLLLARVRFRASNHWICGAHNRSVIREEFELDADEPEVLLGTDSAPNAAEYLLHALAAALTTSIVHVATACEVKLDWVESTITGDSGCAHIDVSFRLAGNAPDEKLREIVERAKRRSAVYDVVTKGVPVAVEVTTP